MTLTCMHPPKILEQKMKASSVIPVLCLAILATSSICSALKRPCDRRGSCIDHRDDDNGLKMDYYKKTCPQAEEIVRNITWSHVSGNPIFSAKLLRLHYHDCFVRGCDGSILIDSIGGNESEKKAIPNLFLAGHEIIDEIKTRLEDECPDTVSCADILSLAARDAVSFQFKSLVWEVRTGRKDGRVSLASEALPSLPSPFSDVSALLQNFEDHDLDINDLVALSGAHTLGETHCGLISNRLYNFTGKGDPDPSLDPDYAQQLRGICPLPINQKTIVQMDPGSSIAFDSHYFVAVQKKMGIFSSDSALMTDPRTAKLAEEFQDFGRFLKQFRASIKKMSAMGTFNDGQAREIRKNCRIINP